MANEKYISVDEKVCEAATNFSRLFFHSFDGKRGALIQMFTLDNPTFVFNGQPYQGYDSIKQFLHDHPDTDHSINVLDGHQVDFNMGYTDPIHMVCSGRVRSGKCVKPFTSTFLLVKEDGLHRAKAVQMRYLY
ncbi:Nuclear transport factor 2, eukaryote domain-containing protein [Strongyloides ratti]|uniref:NTF2-related export protein n=1 Tax=Strongyloides ratti TaxID=34506 RepID=A0A090MXT0_STRRB|nr:Nuclear transport factor 2, eukaryote domain-containing protein [Strongyloides ratti]CEF65969.1 Nuclear transport factor 2, eukaryote domain-containing protein [Strongyloides ratti]